MAFSSLPFLVAHGAGNDVGSLRRAEALGVPWVEADVRLHRGRLEVRHLKTVGPLPILWDRWRLGNPFGPRLQLGQLLDALGPDTELMLDLKGRAERTAALVVSEVTTRPRRRITVCARNWPLLEPFRRLPDVTVVYSIGSVRQLHAFLRRFAGTRLEGVSVHRRLLDRKVVRELAARAEIVLSWPVNTPEVAETLVDWGVQGLISDVPEALGPLVACRTGATA